MNAKDETTAIVLIAALLLLSKTAMAYIAYLAAREHIPHSGWFVFLAIAYALASFHPKQ
ncbi:BioY family protein [Kingella oralis]|uniref:BioY family protein n=1 Tax=Kingella oralis TaxID=505 RepID=UPI0034E49E2D